MKVHIENLGSYSNRWLVWVETGMIGTINSMKNGVQCNSKKELLIAVEKIIPVYKEEIISKTDIIIKDWEERKEKE